AALRAIKDIEFEHSIHRLSDEDYAALREKYRAEARAAMEAMDQGLGQYLSRAEQLIARAPGEAAPTEGVVEAAAAGPAPCTRQGTRKARGERAAGDAAVATPAADAAPTAAAPDAAPAAAAPTAAAETASALATEDVAPSATDAA